MCGNKYSYFSGGDNLQFHFFIVCSFMSFHSSVYCFEILKTKTGLFGHLIGVIELEISHRISNTSQFQIVDNVVLIDQVKSYIL